tara:strand:+ start:78 stop:1241 length:1164 start_codon:yes stop_codon:yes gene_type:complete
MKKNIVILGSTSSIGKSLLNIIKKDKKDFHIVLLTANKNFKVLLKQAKIFNVKNLIISDQKSFLNAKKYNKNKNVRIFNDFKCFDKILKKKADYVMSAISGIEGLKPTNNIIKHTKLIAIANKEAIICGWPIIKKELDRNKTKFIPVDSEHFSIWYSLNNSNVKHIDKIYITASGGPLYKIPKNQLKNIKLEKVLKHPNWKMGKKISVDSATMMNKIFEVIEAKNIFNINYDKLSIFIHPKSYVHALVKFNDGMTKIVLHDTTMKVPIFNTLYCENEKNYKSNKIDLKKLNNLDLNLIDEKKFPLIKILKQIPNKSSLFETVIVSANDELVNLYLENKIQFIDIQNKLLKLVKLKEFQKYKRIKPINIENIYKLNKYVAIKTKAYCV